MILVGQIFNLLGGGPGIPPNLLVNLVQIVRLNTVVPLLDPEHFAQQVAPAGVQIVCPPILKGRASHGRKLGVVLQPLVQDCLNRHPVFRNRILDFQGADVCLHHFLAKIVKVGRQHCVDLPHIDLKLEKMFYVVIDHLQQFNQRLCIIIGAVNCRHFVIDAVPLAGHFQRGVGTEHIGIAPHRAVVPQLVKQLQNTAAVPRDGDIFVKILPAFFLKPALAAQFPNQEPGPPGDIPQLLLVNVLPLKGGLRQLLLQSAAQHGIQPVLRDSQPLLIRLVEHIEGIRIYDPVRRCQNRKEVAGNRIK